MDDDEKFVEISESDILEAVVVKLSNLVIPGGPPSDVEDVDSIDVSDPIRPCCRLFEGVLGINVVPEKGSSRIVSGMLVG